MNSLGTLSGKNILLLQGPIGFFFKKLDLYLRSKGANTFRITLNAADWLFSNRDNTYPFKGKREEWLEYIELLLKENKIDKIFIFGDCRFYQSRAIKVAKQLNIEVFVFEEGYLRPDYVTLERDGVNGFSHISRDAQFYRSLSDEYLLLPTAVSAKPLYRKMAFAAIFYYISAHLFSFKYPNYIHHREASAVKEFLWWWYHIFLKVKYQLSEKKVLEEITSDWSTNYYFVPLQTHNDFQLKVHSRFDNIEEFITEVIKSFALHAPKGTMLLFKHHPQDRGRKDYNHFINDLATAHAIIERIKVVHDTHLPSCLEHSIGTVTINSTVGLSSLIHNKPTIALGRAIYDIKGITNRDMSLDDFWVHYQAPEKELFQKFRTYLLKNTQLNGSFYGKFPVEFN